MADRPAVTPALHAKYCTRFRNCRRWGPEDEIGTLNFITPDVIRRAATVVRQGKVISCALNFDMHGPQTGAFGRVNPLHSMVATGTDHVTARQRLAGFDTVPFGWGFADDQVTMFLQCGTQWDALGHIFHHGKMYGGRDATLVSSTGAARNAGMEVGESAAAQTAGPRRTAGPGSGAFSPEPWLLRYIEVETDLSRGPVKRAHGGTT